MEGGNDKVYLSLKELQLLTNWVTLAPLSWKRKQYFSVRSYQNTNRRLFLSKMLVSISKRFDSLGQIFFKLFDIFDGTIELRLDIRIIAVGDGNVEVMLKWSFKCFKQIDLNPLQSSRPATFLRPEGRLQSVVDVYLVRSPLVRSGQVTPIKVSLVEQNCIGIAEIRIF